MLFRRNLNSLRNRVNNASTLFTTNLQPVKLIPLSASKSYLRYFSSDKKPVDPSSKLDVNATKKIDKSVEIKEKHKGKLKSESFKAETKEILDIVSRSIYTNKEIFVRELISNASDAMEQLRYLMRKNPNDFESEVKFRIDILTDQTNNRIIIQDNGIGMTKSQLIENLGTIAKSGSKSFMKNLKSQGDKSSSIIGQFGVGFYSSFMISKKVEVFTKSSCKKNSKGLYWVSDGKGTFSISEAENVNNGTKIVINLNKDCTDYSKKIYVEKIIKRYSNFVEFPIFLNNKKINMEGALWLEDPKSVSDVRHAEFYKNLTNAYDDPMIHIHFKKDFPLSLSSVLYIPKFHSEKYGNARMEPGVSLYSKKVLIQKKSNDLLPGWARFVKGVADSEDLNLNISRDSTQNSATLKKIGKILIKTLLSRLRDLSKSNAEKYNTFYGEYDLFLKEGICTDNEFKHDIAPLLRLDSSKITEDSAKSGKKTVSLDDYIGNMDAKQEKIYYLVTSNRLAAENSPYFESFRKNKREVLFLYNPIDEFVMKALGTYSKRPFVSIESSKLDENDVKDVKSKKGEFELNEDQTEDLCQWLSKELAEKVRKVQPTSRLDRSPAVVTGHESASMQMMMNLTSGGKQQQNKPQTLNINPAHPVIRGLYYTMTEEVSLAKKVANQLFDNAMIDASLLKDPRGMLGRMNELMAAAMDVEGIEMELREKKMDVQVEKVDDVKGTNNENTKNTSKIETSK